MLYLLKNSFDGLCSITKVLRFCPVEVMEVRHSGILSNNINVR